MTAYKHILDNRNRKLLDYLFHKLKDCTRFDFVSAYFSVFGFDLLKDELESLESTRILFGEPSSIETIDSSKKLKKSFNLEEDGLLTPTEALQQNFLAKRCSNWIKNKNVQIKSIRERGFLHGKLYLTNSNGQTDAVVGSSNFTARGLGRDSATNIEINLAVKQGDSLEELVEWFDEVWNDGKLTEDVKGDVLRVLSRIGKDHAPELIYYKTLYELYKDDLERISQEESKFRDTDLYSSGIWKDLFQFQKDGARSAIVRLIKNNGCILADSVGLGKTFTALAVIKYFELKQENVLVLCPKKLYWNWALYPVYNSQRQNPYLNDRFRFTVLAHTDLTRSSGMAGSVNLAEFNWKNFDLIVIDESHNFRNDNKSRLDDKGITVYSRYSRLLEEVLKQGTRTKVLMLSATPVNTSLIDLRNQIYLITEKREDAFRDLGISNVASVMSEAEKVFTRWARTGNKTNKLTLFNELNVDFIRLLSEVTIARSRRQIEQYYTDEIDSIGGFPSKESPRNFYPLTDIENQLSYEVLAERIEKLTLSLYRPTNYINDRELADKLLEEKKKYNFNQVDREQFLIGMMRTNFLKRLESSANSLQLTMNRTIEKLDVLLRKIEAYLETQNQVISNDQIFIIEELPDEDMEDEEFVVNPARNPIHLNQLDLDFWVKDLKTDRTLLKEIRDELEEINPARDGKLLQLIEIIKNKSQCSNRKLLLFTTFKDTAKYLFDQLTDVVAGFGLKMALVSGDETFANYGGENKYEEILSNFSPKAKKKTKNINEIDLLIATDCISEGQNLQDCDTVINYDIHWNPVRVIQRFGRINRIGSTNSSVSMINFWPTKSLDLYLKLENRVQARMALVDLTGAGDDDPFEISEEDIQNEIKYRDLLTRLIKDEIIDLDEISNGFVMSDFSMDQYLSQLLQYLNQNREQLENTPLGAYAVTECEGHNLHPGVIFFLRQIRSSSGNKKNRPSPIYPYFGVYVRKDDGHILFGCSNIRSVLDSFNNLTKGKSNHSQHLCDMFSDETSNGEKMGVYEQQLNRVCKHIMYTHSKFEIDHISRKSGKRDAKLDKVNEVPKDLKDFELITWLVIY